MNSIKNEIESIKDFVKEQNILHKEFLTLEELTIYLGQSKSSIYKLTSKKVIPFYTPGGKKLYFKRSEIDDWVNKSRNPTDSEIEEEMETYLDNEGSDCVGK